VYIPAVLRDEIQHILSESDDGHLRTLIGDKDPDITRLLLNHPRDADWLEQVRDSSEGEMITDMVASEIAKRGQ
jgi:hypothetical protein